MHRREGLTLNRQDTKEKPIQKGWHFFGSGGWISLTAFAPPLAKGREQALTFLCSLHRTATLHDFVVQSLIRIRTSGMNNARPKGLTIFMAPAAGYRLLCSLLRLLASKILRAFLAARRYAEPATTRRFHLRCRWFGSDRR